MRGGWRVAPADWLPDVVHLHCTNPVALVYLEALRRLRRPLVYTAHVVTPHEPIRWQQRVYTRIHDLPDRVVAHSEVDRRRLLDEFSLASDRVRVIPHGDYDFFERPGEPQDRAEARQALGLPADAEVALFFGYIREYKGLDLLLDAWPRVQARRPRARLVVAGDPVNLSPERRHALETQADGVGRRVSSRPTFRSATCRATSRRPTLWWMPYRRISQSGVLFAALSLGVPVVATRVGALPEVIEDGVSGRLVPPEAVDDLADGIADVLGDAALRARLAEGGREVARRHAWPAIAERTEARVPRAQVASSR